MHENIVSNINYYNDDLISELQVIKDHDAEKSKVSVARYVVIIGEDESNTLEIIVQIRNKKFNKYQEMAAKIQEIYTKIMFG